MIPSIESDGGSQTGSEPGSPGVVVGPDGKVTST